MSVVSYVWMCPPPPSTQLYWLKIGNVCDVATCMLWCMASVGMLSKIRIQSLNDIDESGSKLGMEKHTSTMPSCNKSRVTEFKLNESNALANTKANGRSATFIYLFDMIHYNILNTTKTYRQNTVLLHCCVDHIVEWVSFWASPHAQRAHCAIPLFVMRDTLFCNARYPFL